MKSHTRYLFFNTPKRRQYINITGEAESALAESGIREGMALVSAMHITSGVWINDAEEGIIADIDEILDRSSMTPAMASKVLLNLELKKLIQELQGKQFVRKET